MMPLHAIPFHQTTLNNPSRKVIRKVIRPVIRPTNRLHLAGLRTDTFTPTHFGTSTFNLDELFSNEALTPEPTRYNDEAQEFKKRAALLNNPRYTEIKGTLNIEGQIVEDKHLRAMMVKALSYSHMASRINNNGEHSDSRDYWGSCAILKGIKNNNPVYKLIFTPSYYMPQPLSHTNKAHCAELEAIKKAQRIADNDRLENPTITFLMNINLKAEEFPKKNLKQPHYDITPCGTCQNDIQNLVYKYAKKEKSDDPKYKNTVAISPKATIGFIQRHKLGDNTTTAAPMSLLLKPVNEFYGNMDKNGIPIPITSVLEPLLGTTIPKEIIKSKKASAALTRLKQDMIKISPSKGEAQFNYLLNRQLPATFQHTKNQFDALPKDDDRTLERVSFQIALSQYNGTKNNQVKPLSWYPTIQPNYAPKSRIESMSGLLAGMSGVLKYIPTPTITALLFVIRTLYPDQKKQNNVLLRGMDRANAVLKHSTILKIPMVGFYTPSHAYDAHELEIITNKQAKVPADDMLVATIRQIDNQNVIYLETVADIYPHLYISAGNKNGTSDKKQVG